MSFNWIKYNSVYCPSCNTIVKHIVLRENYYYKCENCNKNALVTQNIPDKVNKYSNLKNKPDTSFLRLNIGTKITLEDIEYVIVGIGFFKEKKTFYAWKEYYLQGENESLVISDFKNTYNIIRPQIKTEEEFELSKNSRRIWYKVRHYQEYLLYNYYDIVVKGILGQIPENALGYERTYEYVRAPKMITKSWHTDSETYHYFDAEYLSARELKKASGIKLPSGSWDVFGTKVFNKNVSGNSLLLTYLIFVILTYFVSDSIEKIRPEIVHQRIQFSMAKDNQGNINTEPIVSKSFTTNSDFSTLSFELYADVENDWAETQVTLVNELTNEEIYAEIGTEFYRGVSDGESWSEGSRTNIKTLSLVEKGNYHIIVKPFYNARTSVTNMSLEIIENKESLFNFWFTMFLASLYPLIFFISNIYYNNMRWENSDITHH